MDGIKKILKSKYLEQAERDFANVENSPTNYDPRAGVRASRASSMAGEIRKKGSESLRRTSEKIGKRVAARRKKEKEFKLNKSVKESVDRLSKVNTPKDKERITWEGEILDGGTYKQSRPKVNNESRKSSGYKMTPDEAIDAARIVREREARLGTPHPTTNEQTKKVFMDSLKNQKKSPSRKSSTDPALDSKIESIDADIDYEKSLEDIDEERKRILNSQ